MEHNNQMVARPNLDEVSFIRPILIILLVLYHAFAPWCGAWRAPVCYIPNETYWWIGKTAYSFMLPMFVFISGYVWSYQREILQKKDTLRTLILKKFKRLYIPSLIFSVAYLLIFDSEKLVGGGNQLISCLIKVVGGYAHMWFLPMLFWTFLFTYLILQIRNRHIRWIVVLVLCATSIAPFPLRIEKSLFYIVYFYAGYETLLLHMQSKQEYSLWMIVILWLFFALLFASLTMTEKVFSSWYSTGGIIQKAFGHIASNFVSKVYGFTGIMALFVTSLRYTNCKQLNNVTIKVGEYCFGVYLIQQFILQALYYHTSFSVTVDGKFLPWCGFVITLVTSLLLSFILKFTHVGKKLI